MSHGNSLCCTLPIHLQLCEHEETKSCNGHSCESLFNCSLGLFHLPWSHTVIVCLSPLSFSFSPPSLPLFRACLLGVLALVISWASLGLELAVSAVSVAMETLADLGRDNNLTGWLLGWVDLLSAPVESSLWSLCISVCLGKQRE